MAIHSFSSFEDVTEWLDSLESAETVTAEGSFTPGEALAHCAQSLEMQRTGYPEMKPTIVRRTVGAIARTAFLRRGAMKHATDAPIPGAPELPATSLGDGARALREAIEAFDTNGGPIAQHFMFGAVDARTAEQLQSMHIANHADTMTIG